MTPEQIKPLVIRLFEFGEDKWFDYQDDFVALFAEFQKHQDSRVKELQEAQRLERERCYHAVRSTSIFLDGVALTATQAHSLYEQFSNSVRALEDESCCNITE